jgi:hypothetical protein
MTSRWCGRARRVHTLGTDLSSSHQPPMETFSALRKINRRSDRPVNPASDPFAPALNPAPSPPESNPGPPPPVSNLAPEPAPAPVDEPDHTLSTLASVVSCGTSEWTLLPSDDPFSQFHAKFWGMEPEQEKERRISDSRKESMAESTDVDQENEYIGKKFGPGCYILDLGDFKGFHCSKLWIRQDYIKIYDHCEREYEAAKNGAPSVLITGHPGIGEYKLLVMD